MKNVFTLLLLAGLIGFSGCYDAFLSSDLDLSDDVHCPMPNYNYQNSNPETPCESNYNGPGTIQELSNGEEANDRYENARLLETDEEYLYLLSGKNYNYELISIDKSNGLLAYNQPLPNQPKEHYNGQKIHAFKDEFWAFGRQELIAINKQSGIKSTHLNFNISYDEISRTEDGYIASMIVDCEADNFINLDLINPQTGIANTFHTEKLGDHVGADITYLGKFMDRKMLDLFLMNTHGGGIKENKIIAIDINNKKKVWEQKLHFAENIFNRKKPYKIIDGIFMIGADYRFYAYDLNRKAATQFHLSLEVINDYYLLTEYNNSFLIFGASGHLSQISRENGEIINSNSGYEHIKTPFNAITVSNDMLYITQAFEGLTIVNLKDLEKISEIHSPRIECDPNCPDFQNNLLLDNGNIYLADLSSVYKLTLEAADLTK